MHQDLHSCLTGPGSYASGLATLILNSEANVVLGGVDLFHKVSSAGLDWNQHGWVFTAVSPDPRGLLALFLHSLSGVNIQLNTINESDQVISIDHLSVDPKVAYGINNKEEGRSGAAAEGLQPRQV